MAQQIPIQTDVQATQGFDVLTSGSAKDENTLEEPTKVSPKTEVLNLTGARFTRTFPGNSFIVLRVPLAR